MDELLLYCSPLTGEWRAPNHLLLLAERGTPPAEWMRRGPGAMTRAWCMFEMVSALAKGCTLHVVLSRADVDGLQTLLTERLDEVAGILAALDARDAQISKAEDREYICGQIARLDGGLGTVTKTVCTALREWLVAEGRAALERLPAAERGTSGLIVGLAKMLYEHGKLDEAEPLFREALQAYREVLGDRHQSTLASINNLGVLLRDTGSDLGEAEALFREALQAKRETLGDRHLATLTSMLSLGKLLKAKGDLDGARERLRDALQALRETVGDDHPKTRDGAKSLAELLRSMGRHDESERLVAELHL